MSVADAAAAAAAKDYDAAIKMYSELLQEAEDADRASLLAVRAGLYSKLGRDDDAMLDAKAAVDLDPENTKALHVLTHLLFKVKEFEAARHGFERLTVLEPKKRVYAQWVDMCRVQLGEELTPSSDIGAAASMAAGAGFVDPRRVEAGEPGPTSVRADDPEAAKYWRGAPAAAAPVAPSLYRHQWFQTEGKVEVAVLAKRLPPERVHVELTPRRMRVTVRPESNDGGGGVFDWDAKLAGDIDPDASRWAVLSTKIEIVLVKARPGPWTTLEATHQDTDLPDQAAAADVAPLGAQPERGAALYPYAGKKIDWDRIEANVAKEEADEEVEGDAGVMSFFQKLYREGDDDFRRAMMKSYVESGGTELSTNWGEVASKDFKAAAKQEEDG